MGYWLFRHPSTFNFSTPEEKALIKNTREVFDSAHHSSLTGPALGMPVWSWGDLHGNSEAQPTVLLLHGWGGEAGLMGAFVSPLLDLGYRVLIPDLPGQGSFEGRLVDTRISASAIVELDRHFGPLHAIIGHSLGGLLGCMVSAGHTAIGGKVELEKLVTINSPVSLGSVIDGLGSAVGLSASVIEQVAAKAEYDLGRPLAEAHAQSLLEEANLSGLAFHDTDDPFIPHAGSLARLVTHPSLESVDTSGLGHIRVLEEQSVIGRVAAFLGPAA